MTTGGVSRRGAVARAALSFGLLGAVAVAAACGPAEPRPLRAWSPSYEFRMTLDPLPPHANEPTVYRIVVLDRETKQPIENGEGQLFATSEDRVNRWDSFTPAPEAGTYTARITYLTAGDWKVALRFRRDSTAKLEQVEDWVQTVARARPVGDRPYK